MVYGEQTKESEQLILIHILSYVMVYNCLMLTVLYET
jgi:hypothetical protein